MDKVAIVIKFTIILVAFACLDVVPSQTVPDNAGVRI